MEIKVLKKVDWKILHEYSDNSLIIANKHPDYDIWILNYSPKVQSKKFWDEYTLSSRGLIIDIDGNILARPFQKFKNLEELLAWKKNIGPNAGKRHVFIIKKRDTILNKDAFICDVIGKFYAVSQCDIYSVAFKHSFEVDFSYKHTPE